MNDYEEISDEYIKTHEKPDKKYSMIPTTLEILRPLQSKTVVDVGCGDGFFTEVLAKEAALVYGIDNSEEQIHKAKETPHENITYVLADMHTFTYPPVDVIFSPFVLNYVQSTEELQTLFNTFYAAFKEEGMFAAIIDMPKQTIHDMKKFGSIKKIKKLEEGQKMDVELYNGEEHITTLHSFYHTKETIKELLSKAGFSDITWHDPIISPEGLNIMTPEFWKGYKENCDLAYVSARKH